MSQEKKRYHFIDAVRGLSILLMIVHHFAFDLWLYDLIPEWLLENPVVDALHLLFASAFIAISGASSTFSHNNSKRGLQILLAAAAVTFGSWVFDPRDLIRFGILHFLGVAALAYAALRKTPVFQKTPGGIWLLLFAVSYPLLNMTFPVKYLYPLGFRSPSFTSGDYFPVLPWIFMYFFGVWLGRVIKEERQLPAPVYRFRSPFFEACGRHTLWIYLLHQPVLIAVTWCLAKLFAKS